MHPDSEAYHDTCRRMAAECDRRIERALPRWEDCEPLTAAVRDTMTAGGKRFRAILAVASADLLGCEPEAGWQVGLAIEFLHAYSLVHDDLPCMDNATTRRGKPAAHITYGEANALLLGDALLTLSFERISTVHHVAEGAQSGLVRELARAAGGAGMVGGQWLDLAYEGHELDEQAIRQVQGMKTGALITFAACCGCYIAADSRWLSQLREYGGNLGAAFQMADDLLDERGDTSETGKDTGIDGKAGKPTIAHLRGVSEAQEMAQHHARRARETVQTIPAATPTSARARDLLAWLADYAVNRKR